MIYAIIALCLVILVVILLPTKNKHKKQRDTSQKVYAKIKSFSFEGQMINYLRKIDPFVFEEFLLDCFERKGYKVIRNKRYTGDGGIDGKVIIDNQIHLIQAKRYSSHINKQHLFEFISLVESKKAKGLFIHTGRTGKGSKELTYNSSDVKIISGNELIELIKYKTHE